VEKGYKLLIEKALSVRNLSYSPYSKFKVGAAVLTPGGKIYTGTNIENASYSVTICAERAAFARAISDGEREFTAIAIATNKDMYAYPCGTCRQFMSEFSKDIEIILVRTPDDYKIVKLGEIFSNGFELEG
jgi:cytidine deaminase